MTPALALLAEVVGRLSPLELAQIGGAAVLGLGLLYLLVDSIRGALIPSIRVEPASEGWSARQP